MNNARLLLVLPQELKDRTADLARYHGVSVASAVRTALRSAIHEAEVESARREREARRPFGQPLEADGEAAAEYLREPYRCPPLAVGAGEADGGEG